MRYVLYNQEKRVLEAIIQYMDRFGYAPTLREIGELLGMSSPATVHEHIQTLILKGFLVKNENGKRGFDLAPKIKKRELGNEEPTLDLPLYGFIAAGAPIEPHPDQAATFRVPASMIKAGKQGYTLQVRGDSMKDDGILDGDYVVIEYTQEAKDGDIVVALLEHTGFATLKRFYKGDEVVILRPANSQMQPIYAKNVKIQGKVVGLVRKFTS